MKVFFLLFLIVIPFICVAQNCGIDFNKFTGITFLRKDIHLNQGISNSLNEELALCKRCLKQTNLTKKQKAQLSNYIAGTYYHFTNEADSVDKYVDLLYHFDPLWFEEHISEIDYKSKRHNIYKDFFHPYYLLNQDLKKRHSKKYNFDPTIYYNKLDSIAESKNVAPAKNLEYAQELSTIKINDQKFRGVKITNKNKQAELDLRNRISLDSLYNIYGFPTKERIGSKQLLTPWLVLQHSKDCKWNEKWLRRFLTAYKNEERDIGLLPQTFHRFYNPENGYCTQQDKQRAIQFINSLKEKFPEEYQDIFGYRNY